MPGIVIEDWLVNVYVQFCSYGGVCGTAQFGPVNVWNLPLTTRAHPSARLAAFTFVTGTVDPVVTAAPGWAIPRTRSEAPDTGGFQVSVNEFPRSETYRTL